MPTHHCEHIKTESTWYLASVVNTCMKKKLVRKRFIQAIYILSTSFSDDIKRQIMRSSYLSRPNMSLEVGIFKQITGKQTLNGRGTIEIHELKSPSESFVDSLQWVSLVEYLCDQKGIAV